MTASYNKKTFGPSGHRERLRKRFARSGRNGLADYELLELLLTFAIPRVDTKPIAKALLHRFGSLLAVLQQPTHLLLEIDGIGTRSALLLNVIQSCLTRCMESAIEEQPSICGPEDIFAFVRLHLGSRANECAYALYLDHANRIVHHAQVASGTVDRTALYPREVLKPAFLYNAAGLVLVHNHPAGIPQPSQEDLEMTDMLEEIAAPFNIDLVDHLIVTRMQAYSIKTGKLL